ncbi:DUF4397 domain-containing protein [Mucilaginibacter sp. RS28]|uniref:DUF4397 domain-containing protein n=1 Tax=Mucilaginibacter straminoryzae TaxID=2932774 RepID=A0A9X2BDG7_9SPHI|nr:DUF4397 domain-containing protein [Mucilaginibacter straminoryzae]MCJ8210318.1 DUF4397 domain-containing protein [Mucilaginibacter straminoryzae]
MKNRYSISCLLLCFAVIFSCKKQYDVPPNSDATSTYLNVVNGTTDTLNFYLNGTRQNNTTDIYPGGSTGYLTVPAGQNDYQVKRRLQSQVYFTKNLNLIDSTNYSVFIGGGSADQTFLVKDSLTKVSATDSATVRFVHTSANAPALDVVVSGSKGFSNYAFKSASPFKHFVSGLTTVKVYLAGTQTLKASQQFTLNNGSIYTLYIKGVPDGTGRSALTINLFTNQ